MASGPSGKQPGRGDSPFAAVPKANIQRSTFDRSHAYKTTFDAGLLIPIYCDEALPGDTFTLKLNAFARLATPLKPIMDNLHLETFFFAVPIRLVWFNWQKFMGERLTPGDTTDFTVPQVVYGAGEPSTGVLSDYIGIPLLLGDVTPAESVCAFWHRSYNLIWNEWFRDENLQDPASINTTDSPSSESAFPLRRRGKRHDYFTSCLPWPQKPISAEIVTASVGIPVRSTGEAINFSDNVIGGLALRSQLGGPASDVTVSGAATALAPFEFDDGTLSGGSERTGLEVLVNQMRQSVQIQKLLERDARGGTRYTEIIKSHFGVTSPDSRLQRPEYLGGGYGPVTLNPVAQTSSDPTETTPQANLAAIGTASLTGGFHKSFTEHCVIIGLACVRADQTYQFGIDRMFSRTTRFDFFWPALAQIGEQAVLLKEITAGPGLNGNLVFGYQERYAEYRYKKSLVTSLFRSDSAPGATLDLWHLAQDYAFGLPVLNSDFIEENPPIARVIAVPSEPHFLYDSFISLKCARPMPVFGTPGFVDHF